MITRACASGDGGVENPRAVEMGLFEDLFADFKRHGSSLRNMAFWAVATYRIGNWTERLPSPLKEVGGKLYGVLSFAVELASGITLNREARIGRDLHLVHSGNIKVHPGTVIGDRVGIMHDVTLGTGGPRDGVPTIGNDVFIGAGAKVLGPVKVGDGSWIAANSLVVQDVPAGTTAIGVPAKILRYPGRSRTA
jgi:serine O-acetyltransferase